MPNSRQSYGLAQILLHWTIVAVCVVAFYSAEALRRMQIGKVFGIPGTSLDRALGAAHEWGGGLLLLAVLLLVMMRTVYGAPSLPPGIRAWQRWTAKGFHLAIYASLIALPASGAATLYYSQRFAALHVALTQVGLALIVIHVVAVVWHQIVLRDRLFFRMWPWR